MDECQAFSPSCRLQPDYSNLDKILAEELCIPFSAHKILNESNYCIGIPLGMSDLDLISISEYLEEIRDSIGLYHLWIDMEDSCEHHNFHRMLAVYVGKGLAEIRIKDHIKNKWPATETIYISFFECENRIAKYLEQLFLDLYRFELNTNENPGTIHLHGFWDSHRYDNGTETHRLGEILVERLYLGTGIIDSEDTPN